MSYIAEDLAKKQKEISVAEFFERNRHMLGFDSPTRSLFTCVKEGVDNSLDACEEASILPDITITLKRESGDEYTVEIGDNGPGIVKAQIGSVFGKLLYGSRFHAINSPGDSRV
jgi:DNA topoisomerase VI, subunit B